MWLKLLTDLQAVSAREAVRFIAVSQAHAGTFLNAVPKHKPFRLPTWALRLCLQRRLGLPLLAAAAAADGARRSRSGKLFDVLGPLFAKRPGGYTRILKMGFRVGDNAPMAFMELVERSHDGAAADDTAAE